MPRRQRAVDAQLCPCVCQIRQRNPAFFVLGVRMPLVGKAVHPILAAQIPFAELTVMVKGDLLSGLKERGEVGVLCGLVNRWWLDNEEWHLRGGDRRVCGVIKLNEV